MRANRERAYVTADGRSVAAGRPKRATGRECRYRPRLFVSFGSVPQGRPRAEAWREGRKGIASSLGCRALVRFLCTDRRRAA